MHSSTQISHAGIIFHADSELKVRFPILWLFTFSRNKVWNQPFHIVCVTQTLWYRPLNTVLFSNDIVVIEIRTRVRLDTIILTVTFVIEYSYFTSKDFRTQCLWSISYVTYDMAAISFSLEFPILSNLFQVGIMTDL